MAGRRQEEDNTAVWYYPEPEDFGAPSQAMTVAQTVIKCAVRWATRYLAYMSVLPAPPREGNLPPRLPDRLCLVNDLFLWHATADLPVGQPRLLCLRMWSPADELVDMHDGFPTGLRLKLTGHQFTKLRECLSRAGLPRDMYFPRAALHKVMEPTVFLGGIILMERRYSPRQWRQRETDPGPMLQLPSEQERQADFVRICEVGLSFVGRHVELLEQGEPAPAGDLDALRRLLDQLQRCRDSTASTATAETRHTLPSSSAASDASLRSVAATAAVYDRIATVALLRGLQLREPGRVPDPLEIAEVESLATLARRAYMTIQRAVG